MHRHAVCSIWILLVALRVRIYVDVSRRLVLRHERDPAWVVVYEVVVLLLLLLRIWHLASPLTLAIVIVRPHSTSGFKQRSGVVVQRRLFLDQKSIQTMLYE